MHCGTLQEDILSRWTGTSCVVVVIVVQSLDINPADVANPNQEYIPIRWDGIRYASTGLSDGTEHLSDSP